MDKKNNMQIYFKTNFSDDFFPEKIPEFLVLNKKEQYPETNLLFIKIENLKKCLKIILENFEINTENKNIIIYETDNQIIELRNKVVLANLGLVFIMVKSFFPTGRYFSNSSPLDLVQEGVIGSILATQSFDYKRGCKFSTYAVWPIGQGINRSFFNQGVSVKLPDYIRDIINKAQRASLKFKKENQRIPTIKELAKLIDVPEDEIIKAKKIRNYERERALRDAVLVEKSKKCNYELIDKSLSVEEIVERKEITDKIIKFLYEKYPPEIALALVCRLIDGETLAVVGKKLKLSRERIRQIEEKALVVLKLKFNGNKKAQ